MVIVYGEGGCYKTGGGGPGEVLPLQNGRGEGGGTV